VLELSATGAEPLAAKPGRLRVTEHYLCAEGEGRTLGALTYLIRLSGCDLRCWWCDSKFSSFDESEAKVLPAAQVEKAALASGAAWASFTGGEPTWRTDAEIKTLAALCARLRKRGLKVKFETNGRRLPAALKACVDLWSVAPKWDGRAGATTKAMTHDTDALALFSRRYAPARLQFKFVVTDDAGKPRAADLDQAAAILKALPKKMPVFFIPEAYAKGDYLGRCRALEPVVAALAAGPLKGWDLRVQPQWHRVLHGDGRRK
jgi:organic radical activating enzyme